MTTWSKSDTKTLKLGRGKTGTLQQQKPIKLGSYKYPRKSGLRKTRSL